MNQRFADEAGRTGRFVEGVEVGFDHLLAHGRRVLGELHDSVVIVASGEQYRLPLVGPRPHRGRPRLRARGAGPRHERQRQERRRGGYGECGDGVLGVAKAEAEAKGWAGARRAAVRREAAMASLRTMGARRRGRGGMGAR
jgi:hypothetical protein